MVSSRRLAAMLSVLAALLACAGCGESELTIILVSLDTTRPDHLSPYGYDRETTPTLARLAREGVLFSGARTTASWTLPAHMSLMTGQPPGVHGVVIDPQRLDGGLPIAGEIFRNAGFGTLGAFSAPYVHGRFGFDRGMDFYERVIRPTVYDLPVEKAREQLAQRERLSHREVSARKVFNKALWFLENGRQARKLLFLHVFDPHYDYLAPPPFAGRYVDPDYAGPVTGDLASLQQAMAAGTLEPADQQHVRDLYDAELAWVDNNLARLLAYLKQRGRIGSTIVVVTADHGEEFFEHGRFGHRQGLYDEVLRVPLIVWGPGLVPEGRRVEADVSLVDVLPTLMDYAGLEPDENIYGRSLRPLMEGRGAAPRPVYAHLSEFPNPPQGFYTRHEALLHGGLKLLRSVQVAWDPAHERDLDGAEDPDSVRWEVYDLSRDPGEQQNLHGSGDPRLTTLEQALEQERERQREWSGRFQRRGPSGRDELQLKLYESLKAQGYL